jgi:PadR family transcriptional regulator, regulatory protein PadR
MDNKKIEKTHQQIKAKYHDQIVFDLKRGFLQFVTLVIISESPKYVYEIKAEILKQTRGGFDIDRNNLYKKLRSLESDGILKSHMEPSARGAQRKYYTITRLGTALLKETHDLLFPLMASLRLNLLQHSKP